MTALNLFRALGDFTTDVLFIPYDFFRQLSFESWWASNAVNIVLILTGMLLFVYWLFKLQEFKRLGTEEYQA